jgi:hypothetical protein
MSSITEQDNRSNLNSDADSCGSLSVEEWFSEDSIQKEIDEQNEFDDRVQDKKEQIKQKNKN